MFLEGPDLEIRQFMRSERVDQRNIGSIPAARHDNPPDTPLIVTGVECVPFATEKHLEPGIEIHRRGIGRHADIAQIAVHIARGNIHAAAECNGEMREIPANADALLVCLRCSASRPAKP